ncbi:MAG: GNAT family N-acetyltransferase [Fibrobacter sp.]|nr:GNAT family N-acetyltransferase [Fibrobacter sp.]
MASDNHELIITTHTAITLSDKISIIQLVRSIWPSKDGIEHSHEEELALFFADRPEERHIILKCDSIVSGYARVFLREVMIGKQLLRNCALACVCVATSQRLNGYGHQIVRKAFTLVDSGHYDCSLFQTAVPGFYEKLGAKVIYNTCVNSQVGNLNPWWDKFVMIYPSVIETADCIIDIKGKGY